MGSFKVGRHTSNSEEHPVPNYPTWTSGRTRSQVVTPGNNFLILILKGNKMQLSGTAKGMHITDPQFSSEQEFSFQNRLHNLVSHFHVLGTRKSKKSTVIRKHRKGWKRRMTRAACTPQTEGNTAQLHSPETAAAWISPLGVTPTPWRTVCERPNKWRISVATNSSFATEKDSWTFAAKARTLFVYSVGWKETPKTL